MMQSYPLKNLSKSFGQHEVLRKIDFNVEPGEIICIVGSSGSGKSTLLRCINKLETQTSGKIRYHGKEIGAVQKEINEYRSKVGMVFQSFNLFNNMTVLRELYALHKKGAASAERGGIRPGDHTSETGRHGTVHQCKTHTACPVGRSSGLPLQDHSA